MKFRLILAVVIGLILGLIRPSTADAARPDAPKYALRGPFTVGTRELKLGNGPVALDATLWYPALNPKNEKEEVTYRYGLLAGPGKAIQDAPINVEKGPYPLIIFSHGLGGARYQSVTYTEQLASYGFVVIAADHPGSTINDVLRGDANAILTSFARRPLEVLQQIAYFETLPKDDPLVKAIDLKTIGVTGHSFGGYTTLASGGGLFNPRAILDACQKATDDPGCAFASRLKEIAAARGLKDAPDTLWPATTDPRIKAIAALAPSSGNTFGKDGFAAIKLPTLIIVGSADDATPPDQNAVPAYQGISSETKALAILENAGHYIFVEKCSPSLIAFGRFAQCSDKVWDMDRAHDIVDHLSTAFFLMTLKGDKEAAKALLPASVDFAGVRYQTTVK